MSLTILRSPEEWTARFGAGRTVLSIGNFDGLHLGHQKILRTVLARARAAAQTAAAVTFDPHPMKLLRPDNAPRMIETLSQRLAGFQQIGLDAGLVLRFDRELSLLSPEDFILRILIERLHVAAMRNLEKNTGSMSRPFRLSKLLELWCRAPRCGMR